MRKAMSPLHKTKAMKKKTKNKPRTKATIYIKSLLSRLEIVGAEKARI
jgi:hypothetical protein